MKKQAGRVGKIPLAMFLGWLAGIISTLFLTAALTQMILSETLAETSTGIGVMVVLSLSAAVDALVSALIAKQRWLQVCVGAGGAYYLTMLGLGILLFEGTFEGVLSGLMATVGASTMVGLFALKGEKGASAKRRFRHYG